MIENAIWAMRPWRRPSGLRIWGGLIVLACVLRATGVGATVIVPLDLGELSRGAGAIVRGRVAAVDSQWSDDRRSIQTIVTIDVENTLKGPLGSTVQLVVPGGTAGRYRSIVVGAPGFLVGQRVVVFLRWQGPSHPYLFGFSQGVFRVVTAGDGSGTVVIPPPIVGPVAESTPIVRGDITRRPLSLAAFEQQVRLLMGGGQ